MLYIGTGESDRSTDSYAGIGVYKSTDDGHSWTLLTGANGTNPIAGLAVSKIAVDPENPNVAYVATGNEVTNASPTAVPGVYRFMNGTWTNLTAIVSANRQSNLGQQKTVPGNAGPDDNYLLSFPQSSSANPTPVTWSDVAVVGLDPTGYYDVIYAALGTTDGSYVTNYGTTTDANAVYYALDPTATPANFAWYIGDGGADAETKTVDAPQFANAGNIKMSVILDDPFATGPDPGYDPVFFQTIHVEAAYASAAPATAMQLLGATSGVIGAGLLPQYLPFFKLGMDYTAEKPIIPADGLDEYNLAVYSYLNTAANPFFPPVVSYIGTESTLQTATDPFPYAGGVSYTNITTDGTGNSPHASFHALAGAGNLIDGAGIYLYAGTDGGIWQLNVKAGANTWTDVNGNLDNALVYGISSAATTPGNILEATQAAATAYYTPGVGWTMGMNADGGSTLNTILPYTETATRVVVSQQDPNTVLAFVNDDIFANSYGDANLTYAPVPDFDPYLQLYDQTFFGSPTFPYPPWVGYLTTLMLSTDGGKTWAPVPPYVLPQYGYYEGPYYQGDYGFGSGESAWGTFGDYTYNDEFQPALVGDTVNGQRFLYSDLYDLSSNFVAGRSLNETLDSGTTFNPVAPPNTGGDIGKVTPIIPINVALAAYQGPFVADPAFTDVTDQGANTDVPGTMYISGPDPSDLSGTGPQDIYLTRDYGQTWVERNLPVTANVINDVEVDPSNSNTVYALVGDPPGFGSGRVWKSTDGGQTWNAIGGAAGGNDGLPDVSANKLVIDSRTGNLYVGTDQGVFELASGTSKWQLVGTGMPTVRVTDLYLNSATNTLIAGTYGAGVWQIPLSDVQSNGGGLTAVSGQTQWSGNIVLTGATTITAQGSQTLQNNLSAAQLIVSGSISDASAAITTNNITIGNPGAGDRGLCRRQHLRRQHRHHQRRPRRRQLHRAGQRQQHCHRRERRRAAARRQPQRQAGRPQWRWRRARHQRPQYRRARRRRQQHHLRGPDHARHTQRHHRRGQRYQPASDRGHQRHRQPDQGADRHAGPRPDAARYLPEHHRQCGPAPHRKLRSAVGQRHRHGPRRRPGRPRDAERSDRPELRRGDHRPRHADPLGHRHPERRRPGQLRRRQHLGRQRRLRRQSRLLGHHLPGRHHYHRRRPRRRRRRLHRYPHHRRQHHRGGPRALQRSDQGRARHADPRRHRQLQRHDVRQQRPRPCSERARRSAIRLRTRSSASPSTIRVRAAPSPWR